MLYEQSLALRPVPLGIASWLPWDTLRRWIGFPRNNRGKEPQTYGRGMTRSSQEK